MMEIYLFILCTSFPSHLIALYQYWDCRWRFRKLAICLAAGNLLLKLWVLGWFWQTGRNTQLLELGFSVIAMGIYFCSIQMSKSKLLFTYVLVLNYLIIVRGIASFLGYRLFAEGIPSWKFSLLCILLYALTLPWILRHFRWSVQMVYQTEAPSLWRIIWLIPAFASLTVLVFTNVFDATSAASWQALFARLCLLGTTVVTYFVLLRILIRLRRQAVLEERTRMQERILALQRTQYADLQAHMEEIRRARHDLRQHQRIIQSFLDSGDSQGLRAYLHSPAADTPTPPIRPYCRNTTVNTLLNYYASKFQAQGIRFEIQSDLPAALPLPEPDLCVILGNLAENALEACSGQEGQWCRISLKAVGLQSIVVTADNTAPTAPQLQSGTILLSSKHDGEGIGTQSIRYIAQQYNGTADFRWEDGFFFASVFLNPL